MSTQPFLAALACGLLDVLHLLQLVVHDPCVYVFELVFGAPDKEMARYYLNKSVVVTGASSGLGEAFALQLAGYKCRCLVLSARSVDKLEATAAQCRLLSPSTHVVVLPLDLEDPQAVEGYAAALAARLQDARIDALDLLINNAGVSSRGSAIDTDLAALTKIMQVNFFGPVSLTRALLPLLLRSPHPAIGVVSSVQGRLGIPLRTSYAASKHALQGFFDGLRAELAPHRASVTVISPGYIATNLSNNAITADGSAYGRTDETTARGMLPQRCAHRSLLAIARGDTDCLIADAKVCAAVQARGMFPALLARMTALKVEVKKET